MKALFRGCKRSDITVTPTNWNTQKASMTRPWQIHYRFYDPQFKGTKLWGKLIQIAGMNDYNTLAERQEATRSLIADELQSIDEEGHNPITKLCLFEAEGPAEDVQDIDQNSPYLVALRFAFKHVKLEPHTREDITSVLKYYERSAQLLGKHRRPLKNIKRRDIIAILDGCKNLTVSFMKKGKEEIRKKVWNDNQFNHYRKYLHILYAFLEKEDIIEYNPVEKIDKKENIKEEDNQEGRIVLTAEQRRLIDISFRATPRLATFHRFLNIFFHSGARPLELLGVQGKHVDLQGQRFKVLIKKGRKGGQRWKPKTIKDMALPYWQEAMAGCRPNDYVFSIGLKPGPQRIRREQLSHRWERHVKKALGIQADLYSLKHLHSTEVVDILETDQLASDATAQAAAHNSHTSEAMVVKIYDVHRKKREHNKVKGLGNSFGGQTAGSSGPK